MAEEFRPNETTTLQAKVGNWVINLATRRLTDILVVALLSGVGWMAARQEYLASVVAANTATTQAGTAEMRVKLNEMDANARMASCMLRERDAADMRVAEARCRADTGAQR